MTEYVIFNAEHYVMIEGVRFYEQGDALVYVKGRGLVHPDDLEDDD